MVRQDMPSARPKIKGPSSRSTIQVVMSVNSDNCLAIASPAGPQPTINTSTSFGRSKIGGVAAGSRTESGI